jgi:hypothetical protein
LRTTRWWDLGMRRQRCGAVGWCDKQAYCCRCAAAVPARLQPAEGTANSRKLILLTLCRPYCRSCLVIWLLVPACCT